MTNTTIGIVIVCTNAYFVLGIRFIKKFMHFYKGGANIVFYIFTDTDPDPYLPESIKYKYIKSNHLCWRDGTNSKFRNINVLLNEDIDYLFYFDADTNVSRSFDESWFIGDLIAGEHYGNASWMDDITKKPFERNPKSQACVPLTSTLPQTYCYGAFFGGKKDNVLTMCKELEEKQKIDQGIGFEPCWNDESYLNHYFHYNNTTIIPCKNFMFDVSDKAGIGETRDMKLDISTIKNEMLKNKNNTYDIIHNRLAVYDKN